MKKRLLIAISLMLTLCLFASGCQSKSATGEKADSQAFLKDMAEGVQKRCSSNEDMSSMSREEQVAYYSKLVSYELDRIEKYEGQIFENEKFNDLAHCYIDACQMQSYACKYYKNEPLYDALWSGGWYARSSVISTLYSDYDLPISAECAAEYMSGGSVSVDSDQLAEDIQAGFEQAFAGPDLRESDEIEAKWAENGTPMEYGSNGKYVILGEVKYMTTSSEKPVLVITYDFTNNNSTADNLINGYPAMPRLYQNGFELEKTTEDRNSWVMIKDGATTHGWLMYYLRDSYSDVKVECGQDDDYNVLHTKYILLEK